jgi:hypothetical protein
MSRYLFAGSLGVVCSIIVMAILDQPYALYVSAPASLVVGWFSNDIYHLITGKYL